MRENYTRDQLDQFALDDLRIDAEGSERQAVEGPFFPERGITKESLLAHAGKYRRIIARYAGGGAHHAVVTGKAFEEEGNRNGEATDD